MSRYTPRQSAEFESRQMVLAFMDGCRDVLRIVVNVKKTLSNFVKGLFRKAAPAAPYFHQLVLELDGIAQIPLFGGCLL